MDDDILIESFEGRSPSLRIAIVTETFPPEINGVAMTLGRIVQGLIARGHLVQVVRPRQARESGIAPADMEEVLARGAALPNYGELRFGLPAKNRLVRLWIEKRPDVVHVVTEGPLGWSAVAAARKMHIAVTSSFHTNFHSYSSHYGLGLLKRSIDSYLRKLHNRTVATMVPTKRWPAAWSAGAIKTCAWCHAAWMCSSSTRPNVRRPCGSHGGLAPKTSPCCMWAASPRKKMWAWWWLAFALCSRPTPVPS